jgi:type IV pilus assembly protein PilP
VIRKNPSHLLAYILVSLFSVSGAFLISLHFVKRARAQDGAPAPAPAQAAKATTAAAPTPPPTAASAPGPQAPPPATPPTTAKTPQPETSGVAGISELEGFLEPFIYDLVNRRDPFQPFAEYIPSNGGGKEEPARALSPAQRWDLDQLKLIGIMWDVKDPKAMFLDPEEDVMILGRDESIGNKNGYVATIREGEVVVVEAIRKRGDIIYKTKVIRIER